MKIIVTLCLLIISLATQGQPVRLLHKDGREINTKINAISNSTLFTPQGNFLFTDLSNVTFEFKQQKDQSTYDRLEAAGVTIQFAGTPITPDAPLAGSNQEKAYEIDQVVLQLEQFRQDRQLGLGLQIMGVGLTVLGSVLYMSDPNGNADIGNTLVIIGGTSWMIGLGIEFGAGSKLRFKK